MSSLAIFTVKLFHVHEGKYYTEGGFGKYLTSMSAAFDHVRLVCKLKRAPPLPGYYEVALPNVTLMGTPAWPTQLGALLSQPIVALRGLDAIRKSDVVHARMPDWTGITGAWLARITGTPSFHQIVDDWNGLAKSIPPLRHFGLGLPLKYALYFYDFLERKVSEDQLVFAQGAVAFDKHKAASERVLILSTAHSRADIGSVRQKFVSERFCILNVARMHSVKNQQLLVHALSRLRQHDQRWHLRIVGEGARRDELHSLASQLGVSDSVEMPGLIEHGPPLWKEYDTADVFALTSLSEGTPKVVLEAMARGCPVVASAVSGVPTAIGDNQRGILFESQNLEGLIDGLTQMARDGAFRHNCQQQGLEFALDHTIETSSMRMLEKLLHRWPQLAPLRTPDA